MEIDRYADSQPGSICKTVFLVDLHLHICRPPFLGQPFNVIYLALHFNRLSTFVDAHSLRLDPKYLCPCTVSARYRHYARSDFSSLGHARSDAPAGYTSHLRPSPS